MGISWQGTVQPVRSGKMNGNCRYHDQWGVRPTKAGKRQKYLAVFFIFQEIPLDFPEDKKPSGPASVNDDHSLGFPAFEKVRDGFACGHKKYIFLPAVCLKIPDRRYFSA